MYEFFLLERHLDRMVAIARELGDELVNVVPDLPGGNSAYQIVFHCCGMLEWWTRSAILGLDVDRDRAAEFDASGTVAHLTARAEQVRSAFVANLREMDLEAPLRGDPSAEYVHTPIGTSVHGALLHVFEELAQHHGQLEITRDLVNRASRGQ